jgi:hypothetical protein
MKQALIASGFKNEQGHWLAIPALAQKEMLEKYTEYIVKECANQCDLLLNHKMSTEWARGTHDCSKAIREYFEIKE